MCSYRKWLWWLRKFKSGSESAQTNAIRSACDYCSRFGPDVVIIEPEDPLKFVNAGCRYQHLVPRASGSRNWLSLALSTRIRQPHLWRGCCHRFRQQSVITQIETPALSLPYVERELVSRLAIHAKRDRHLATSGKSSREAEVDLIKTGVSALIASI